MLRDYTAEPTVVIGAAGAYAIGGETWYAKGALSGLPFGAVMTSGVDNGSGIRISNTSGSPINIGSNADYPGRVFTLPLANIAGYNDALPGLFRARLTKATAVTTLTAHFGIIDSTASSANWLGTQRSRDLLCGVNINGTDVSVKVGAAIFGNKNGNYNVTADNHVVGVYRMMPRYGAVTDQDWTGSFGPETGCLPVVTPGQTTLIGTYTTPSICFALSNSSALPSSVFLSHLSVMQPAV